MNETRKLLELMHETWPQDKVCGFLLEYGRGYHIGPKSFSGRRGKQGECFRNAARLALSSSKLTYVEGFMTVCGVPIEHAWCSNDGVVIDPTITAPFDGIGDYFGIPFKTEYVIAASLRNNGYGLLDRYYSRGTLPKLVELGLEDGQQWLTGKNDRPL